jgi:hypothetical protein
MSGTPLFVVERQLTHFDKADSANGEGVLTAVAAAGIQWKRP